MQVASKAGLLKGVVGRTPGIPGMPRNNILRNYG